MTRFTELRDQVSWLVNELRGFGLSEPLRRELDGCADELMSECKVVVAGEFARGKSSLLNALVGRPQLFPVGIDVTTAVVTELRWGKSATVHVWIGESSQPVEAAEAAKYVTEYGNPDNARDVRRVRLTAPVELLKDGVALVDTPGIGSLNVEHATAAYEAIGEASAVIFVGAADERMSKVELSYLVKAMSRCPLVITVLTKADKLYDASPEVKVARERIADKSGKNPDEVVVLAVSARRKLEAVRAGEEDPLADSGFTALEQQLTAGLVATWGKACLTRVLARVDGVLEKAVAPVNNALFALSSDNALSEVRDQLTAFRARAAELSAYSAAWRSDLAAGFERDSAGILEELSQSCAAAREDFIDATPSARAAKEPEALALECIARLVDAVQDARARLREACERRAADASRQTRMTITAAVSVPQIDVGVRLPAGLGERRRSEGLVNAALKSATVGTTVGATIGGAIGNLLLPGVGTAAGVVGGLAGSVVGLLAGAREHYVTAGEKDQDKVARVLTEVVQPRINSAIDRILSDARTATEAVRDSLLAQLENEIAAEQQSVAESVRMLDAHRSATEGERRSRRALLERDKDKFDRFCGQFDEVRRRVEDLG